MGSLRLNLFFASSQLRLYDTIKSVSKAIFLFCVNMFKKLAFLANQLESPLVNIELEARMKIQQPIDIIFDQEITITYYRSTMYPSIVFRRLNNSELNSKELVEKIKFNDFTIALSIEQSYTNSEIKFPLIESNTRKIYRKRLQEDPIVEITKYNNEFNLEVEFDINNHEKVEKILKEWKSPYWPPIKPMEISSSNLAKKLSHNDQWCISPKADGEHIIQYINDESSIIIHDNGFISDIDGNEKNNIIPRYVYEGELMNNKKILYFDCLMYDYKNITKLDYIKRREYLKEKKEIILFNNVYALKSYLYKPAQYKTDGYIISNIKNKKLVYKSKFINTVDLRYVNGYLLLENEKFSDRIPKDTTYNFEEDKIYEFDIEMNLIKERKDKTIANYRFPYDDNPIYKIINGIGIPTLRYHHNKIKTELLNILPKSTLLDIGSGKGGDIHKWYHLKFKKIYAVDPILDLRQHSKNVVEIRDYVQNIYQLIDYNSVSILFVPWDDIYLDVIQKAKHVVIAWMSNPKNYECDSFKCKVTDKVELNIPHTETSNFVIENKTNYKKILKNLKDNGWYHQEIKIKMEIGTIQERELSRMYTYHYLKKIK